MLTSPEYIKQTQSTSLSLSWATQGEVEGLSTNYVEVEVEEVSKSEIDKTGVLSRPQAVSKGNC